jgi:hypothetical protein
MLKVFKVASFTLVMGNGKLDSEALSLLGRLGLLVFF